MTGRPDKLKTSIRVLVFTDKVILRVTRNFNFNTSDFFITESKYDVTLNIDSESPDIWKDVKVKYDALLQKERDLQGSYIKALSNINQHSIKDVDITSPIPSSVLYHVHL